MDHPKIDTSNFKQIEYLEMNQDDLNCVNNSTETIYIVSSENKDVPSYNSLIDQTANSSIANQLKTSSNDSITNQNRSNEILHFQNQSNQDNNLNNENSLAKKDLSNLRNEIESKNDNNEFLLADRKDMILNLTWSNRDLLINQLNSFSAILSGKSVSNEEKVEMSKKIDHLILILTNLSFRFDKIRKRKFSEDNNQKIIKKPKLEPILDLTAETRINLVDQLVTNQNFSIVHSDYLNDEMRKTLVNENNEFIKFLLELPVGFIDENLVADKFETSNAKDNDQLDFKLNRIRNEFHNKINEIDVCKSQANFIFKLKNVRNFFETDNTIYSDFFYCRGIPWYLCFKSRIEPNSKNDSTKHLEIYLHPRNNDPTNWQIKCYYEISLLSDCNELLNDKTKTANHNFTKKFGNGFKEFCTFKELENYIDMINDSITIKVFLKAERMIRTN